MSAINVGIVRVHIIHIINHIKINGVSKFKYHQIKNIYICMYIIFASVMILCTIIIIYAGYNIIIMLCV